MKKTLCTFLFLAAGSLALAAMASADGKTKAAASSPQQRMEQRRSVFEQSLRQHQALLDQYEREIRERRQKLGPLREQISVLQGAIGAMREAEALLQRPTLDAAASNATASNAATTITATQPVPLRFK